MEKMALVKNNLHIIIGIVGTVIGFIFAEGWLIATARFCGALWGTVIVSVVTIPLSWLIIYLSAHNTNRGFREWLADKEAGLSRRAQAAVKGGKTLVLVNTLIFLGPVVMSILMLMFGFERRKAYLYSGVGAVFCAGIWCSFYAGMWWGVDRLFSLP
ncbi:MAG: hypothetical protein PHS37_05925 [Candidatus Omnitrophica bacterium]|nr:hypothetical protein [Candidatus Omnitrophota bacterium]